ncbi:hypothetical protein [Nocardioides piscis]|uniref:Uncharacterized protein n=1 Tax=Nocardioides piscis TaxID=2714938 RepID=A0A6G7YCL5_9ACTN|nr:hypothetical protein [Nocardioides piscis]QIK74391.1 hypothetical protein G7071_02000 [Nocardioides piscis]
MDPSALIFVALAVAWAVYLIPKALEHHDEAVRSRSVDRFSHTMRVLARREPVNRRDARLVVTPARHPSAPTVATKPSRTRATPTYAERRAAVRKATKRRRRVLAAILLVNTAVIGVAAAQVIAWPYTAIPAGLLVAWLVACRVMVKGERAAARPARVQSHLTAAFPDANSLEIIFELPETADSPLVADVEAVAVEPAAEPMRAEGAEPMRAEGAWDMVPTTLPTYVSKPAAARRTVQTIDLDSTGVWSSGRNDDDSAMARDADESARAERDVERRRASGS